MNDERAIRDVFTRWVEAMRAQDLEGVLADHDPNIVMFDVPPPYDGVRGIDEYRESWPPFFEWMRQGAEFELVELDVTPGSRRRVRPRAVALRHTGGVRAPTPTTGCAITVGLRKDDGRWVVVHEHHSFPMVDTAS